MKNSGVRIQNPGGKNVKIVFHSSYWLLTPVSLSFYDFNGLNGLNDFNDFNGFNDFNE